MDGTEADMVMHDTTHLRLTNMKEHGFNELKGHMDSTFDIISAVSGSSMGRTLG